MGHIEFGRGKSCSRASVITPSGENSLQSGVILLIGRRDRISSMISLGSSISPYRASLSICLV